MLVPKKAEQRIQEVESSVEEHRWTVFASYIVLTYVVALRGNKGLMLELRGLQDQLKGGKDGYCIIVLFGHLKGED